MLNTVADLTGPDVIKFGIESKHSNPLTSTDGFKAAVSEALREMMFVCSIGLESCSTVVSHL
jgi:carnitine O-acetyltransferase